MDHSNKYQYFDTGIGVKVSAKSRISFLRSQLFAHRKKADA
jgi:hypothetical protein